MADKAGKIFFYNHPDLNLIAREDWDKNKDLFLDLKAKIASALNFPVAEVELEHPLTETQGDFSTNIALTKAKELGKNPQELATEYNETLKKDAALSAMVDSFTTAGPGFINLKLKKQITAEYINRYAAGTFLNEKPLSGKRIMFEYAHPNPFKSFHIGHLRNIILGESLIRILEAMGAEVIRTNYQGDVGMHIAKCLWAFMKISEND